MRQIDDPNSAKRHSRLDIASTIIGGLPLLVIFPAILFFVSGDPYKPKTAFVNVLNKICFTFSKPHPVVAELKELANIKI
ncbi:MAG: hypothetical protein ACR2HG_11160 [Pyrinomonadaceae bacterium]